MKKVSAILLAFVLAVSLAACSAKPAVSSPSPSASASPSASSGPVELTDMTGRSVKLDKPAARVVALTAADCEILYAIGAGSTLVGRGEYCDYPDAVKSLPSVQSGSDTNTEQIIALKPDVVIMSMMDQTKDQITALENAGIKVVASDAQNIDGVYAAIKMIGTVTGKSSDADKVVNTMKKTFSDIQAKVKENSAKASGKTVYFEVSPLQYGLYAAGSGTFMDEMAAMLGVKNIFSDMSGWPQVSEEQVIQRNPDYIVSTTMSHDTGMSATDEIKSRKGWESITAVKNNALLNADNSAITRPGPRLADAAEQLYTFIYGDSASSPSSSK